MPKLTESRLRTIIKEELKAVLNEMGAEVIDLEPYLAQEREKESIKNQIEQLALALIRADNARSIESRDMIMNEISKLQNRANMVYRVSEKFNVSKQVEEEYEKIKKPKKQQATREYDPSLDPIYGPRL
jgi:hypothetical protein